MATAGRDDVVLDTSVLINFLAVDRADLLGAHKSFRFLITDHVRAEVTEDWPEQLARLDQAVQAGFVEEISVTAWPEVVAFGHLSRSPRLGAGECSAIAVAGERGLQLAIDDKRARTEARKEYPSLGLLDTVSLMVSLIHLGVMDVQAADAIKRDWEQYHSFRLKFGSFSEMI